MDEINNFGTFTENANQIQPLQGSPQSYSSFSQQLANTRDSGPESYLGGNFSVDDHDVGEDNEAKRRRIARACDMCRKKKIKCDGRIPKCGHCTNYRTECVFTHVEKKRNPPKGAKYIEGLENRLGRMEQLLKTAGLITEEDAGRNDLAAIERRVAEQKMINPTSASKSSGNISLPTSSQLQTSTKQNDSPSEVQISPCDSIGTPQSPSQIENTEGLSEMMCSLVTNAPGDTRYIGSSSALSIFSAKGIEWVNEKTGDNSFQEMIGRAITEEDEAQRGFFWKPDVFGDLFMRRVFRSLPPKDEALSLFRDYFDSFNCMFPLFHEPTFMHLVERQYSAHPYDSGSWWGCINTVLAIAYRIRVMNNVVPRLDEQKAWLYMKNAMAALTELTLQNTDLMTVQALLGMGMFLMGTANPTPSFFLIAAAIRASQSIGLHKKGSSFSLDPIEAEQRKRVYWIAYILDKDISIRSGRPPAQDDDDVNVDLPEENPDDSTGDIPLSDGLGKVNIFRLMCEFSVISSKIYKRLYSVQASKQTDGELLNTIGELDKELEAWKDGIPIDIRPEHEIKVSYPPLLLHIVALHFGYYNAVTTIHRMSVHHGYWTSRLSDFAISGLNARPLNPRVFSSAALCVQAARASIHLIRYIPQSDYAFVWMVMYFPVSALVSIFANILQNPQDPRARADCKLMDLVVTFLNNLVAEEGTQTSYKRMLTICAEFTRIARLVLDKAEKEGAKKKRKVNPEELYRMQQTGQRAMAQAQAIARDAARSTTPPGARRQMSAGNSPQRYMNLPPAISDAQAQLTGQLPASQMRMTDSQTFSPTMTQDYNDMLMQSTMTPQFLNGQTLTPTLSPGVIGGSFQQPFLPQDMWQMPMTFEWDIWQDLNGQGLSTFDGGDVDLNNNT